jgi:CheY-like chemotaxis protein
VEAKEEEQTIYLCVWDKGIGIKAQDLQRIFQPFVQLDSSLAREQSGTGLGLVLVQRMIEMHEGSLHVESTPGAGSRFEIILPWKGFKGADQEAIRQEALGQPLLIQRTMTVEDNEIDAGHLTRFLNKMGIENIVLNQGRFISQHALELQPEIILLDISLPDQSGWSVLHELKSNQATKAIPVIITSVEDKRAEATRLGAAAYLVKPFTFLDLREALGRAAAALRSPTTGPSSAAPLIMLVDDNEINSQTIIDFLEANRYRAMWVSNGWAFLDKAPQEHPDIILMDIQMPGIDGLEVIRRVRAHADKQFAESRIIANTALAMQGDRERCLSAGANEYLSKPFRLNELLAAIHKQLAGPL